MLTVNYDNTFINYSELLEILSDFPEHVSIVYLKKIAKMLL